MRVDAVGVCVCFWEGPAAVGRSIKGAWAEVCWDGKKGVLSGGGIVSRGCPCPGRVCMSSSPSSSGAGPEVCIVGSIHARTPPLAQRGKPLPP